MFIVTAVTWKNLESWAIKSAVEANIKKKKKHIEPIRKEEFLLHI